jgi:hypothetical protein
VTYTALSSQPQKPSLFICEGNKLWDVYFSFNEFELKIISIYAYADIINSHAHFFPQNYCNSVNLTRWRLLSCDVSWLWSTSRQNPCVQRFIQCKFLFVETKATQLNATAVTSADTSLSVVSSVDCRIWRNRQKDARWIQKVLKI